MREKTFFYNKKYYGHLIFFFKQGFDAIQAEKPGQPPPMCRSLAHSGLRRPAWLALIKELNQF